VSQIHEDPAVVVAEACKLLRDPKVWLRNIAAQTLGLLGPKTKDALPDLHDALFDENEQVRWSVEEAIRNITRRET
jgi:HEAT repeat protein